MIFDLIRNFATAVIRKPVLTIYTHKSDIPSSMMVMHVEQMGENVMKHCDLNIIDLSAPEYTELYAVLKNDIPLAVLNDIFVCKHWWDPVGFKQALIKANRSLLKQRMYEIEMQKIDYNQR